MRHPIAAAVATVGLVMTGPLAVAQALETTPTTPSTAAALQTVSVDGVASVPIEQAANATTADATYRLAMAAAIADGQSKAQFLAEKTGVTLGAVQSISEQGGSIECGEAEYLGTMPDFGTSQSDFVTPEVDARAPAATTPAPSTTDAKPGKKASHHKRRGKRTQAKKSSATGCTLDTQVALTYALS